MKIFKTAKKAPRIFIGFLLALIILSGCWDYRDIDKRLFVGTIGIDKSKETGRYNILFLSPVVRAIAGGQEGGGGGGGKEKPVMLESTVADSVTDGARNMALRLNRNLYFEHMRAVIIGEDVAREGLETIVNPFMRQTEFNRRSRIAIAQGQAKKVLEIKIPIERLTSSYIETLYNNTSLSGKFIGGDLGDFLHQIHKFNGNALVSKITPDTSEVNIGGGAVVKNFKLAGWLSEKETQGINFFLGNIKGGNVVVQDPAGKGRVTFIILKAYRELKLVADAPVPEFLLKVEVEGNISETTEGVSLDLKDEKIIESLVSEEIKSDILKGVSKLQKDYKVDLLKLEDYLYKYHPKLWQGYKDRWEDIFPDVRINVDVITEVKNIGVTK